MSRRAHSQPDTADLWVFNDRSQIDTVVSDVVDALGRHRYTESSRFAVRLALEEAISNAFRHGHKTLPKDTPVQLKYRVDDEELQVTIVDQGPGFKPEAVPDPTLEENLDKPSGRGLMLIRAYMSDVSHAGRGNELRMVYKKPPSKD